MNNECGEQHIDANDLRYWCNLTRNHEGSHYNYSHRRTWPRGPLKDTAEFRKAHREYAPWFDAEYETGVLGQFNEEETVTLKLTLTDLKTIAYYMAEEEDADKTKGKIDEALKEML